MHIILFILKIIGILLLALLGILLLLILLVLFVPVRYGINGEKYGKIKAIITFHWLFPVLYGRMAYAEEELIYYVKLFGFKIYPREKNKEADTSKRHKRNKKEEKEAEKELERLVTMELSEKQNQDIIKEKAEKNLPIELEEPVRKSIFIKIEEFFAQIKRSWILLKEKAVRFWEEIKNINRKRGIIFDFIRLEENKDGILKIFTCIKKLLKHLNPGKIKGEVEFGLDDPALTGQALGVISMFYGIYKDQVKILPNFQEVILEGNILMKGRIRVFTLMLICIKLLLDNDFKKLTNNYNRMKEEL